jgi:hypothetical protein
MPTMPNGGGNTHDERGGHESKVLLLHSPPWILVEMTSTACSRSQPWSWACRRASGRTRAATRTTQALVEYCLDGVVKHTHLLKAALVDALPLVPLAPRCCSITSWPRRAGRSTCCRCLVLGLLRQNSGRGGGASSLSRRPRRCCGPKIRQREVTAADRGQVRALDQRSRENKQERSTRRAPALRPLQVTVSSKATACWKTSY